MTIARRLTLATILAVLALGAEAQRPAFYKMSALVREACYEVERADGMRLAPTGGMKHRTMENRTSLTALVKLATDDASVLTDNGCRVLAQRGNLCIAEIPLTALRRLSLEGNVKRIEAGRRASVMMDTTAIVVNAVAVNKGTRLPKGYSGEGVVVGVQDIGFDLTHPNFWTADMSRYRIKAMWDQLSTDTIGSRLPAGRDYVGQEALLTVEHPRDGLIQTHGTHTTGIAAGSGGEGCGVVSPYRGIAYDADICLVCNATTDDVSLIDPKDYYKYTYALDALGFKYIFDYADSVGKPCVINFSEGSHMDFRGDDQLYYEMLDSLTGPGHIIVASAGNMGGFVTYMRKDSDTDSTAIASARGDTYTMVTTRSEGDFRFGVSLYKGSNRIAGNISLANVLAAPDSTLTTIIKGNGLTITVTASAYMSCYDGDDYICDWRIDRDTTNREEDASWGLELSLAGEGVVELFSATHAFYHHDGHIGEGENGYSVNSPSSAPSVISVGSTDWRSSMVNNLGETYESSDRFNYGGRSYFSSVGPTFDGRMKPDVMAPGRNIISSYSSFCQWGKEEPSCVRQFDYDGRTYLWNADSGTSMSAPVVTGIIALWLQAYPQLTPEDCLKVFSATCSHDDGSSVYPNTLYGYGGIDALAGMEMVLTMAREASGIVETTVAPSTADGKESVAPTDKIFTIDGRYAGNDISELPPGIYISGGKKLLRK